MNQKKNNFLRFTLFSLLVVGACGLLVFLARQTPQYRATVLKEELRQHVHETSELMIEVKFFSFFKDLSVREQEQQRVRTRLEKSEQLMADIRALDPQADLSELEQTLVLTSGYLLTEKAKLIWIREDFHLALPDQLPVSSGNYLIDHTEIIEELYAARQKLLDHDLGHDVNLQATIVDLLAQERRAKRIAYQINNPDTQPQEPALSRDSMEDYIVMHEELGFETEHLHEVLAYRKEYAEEQEKLASKGQNDAQSSKTPTSTEELIEGLKQSIKLQRKAGLETDHLEETLNILQNPEQHNIVIPDRN